MKAAVVVSSQGNVNLWMQGAEPGTQYFATEGPGGRIILTPVQPAVVVVRQPDSRDRKPNGRRQSVQPH